MADRDILDGLLAPTTPEKKSGPKSKNSPSPRTKKKHTWSKASKTYRDRKRKREQDSKKDVLSAQVQVADLQAQLVEQQAKYAALQRIQQVASLSARF
jgi:hypothetical protein